MGEGMIGEPAYLYSYSSVYRISDGAWSYTDPIQPDYGDVLPWDGSGGFDSGSEFKLFGFTALRTYSNAPMTFPEVSAVSYPDYSGIQWGVLAIDDLNGTLWTSYTGGPPYAPLSVIDPVTGSRTPTSETIAIDAALDAPGVYWEYATLANEHVWISGPAVGGLPSSFTFGTNYNLWAIMDRAGNRLADCDTTPLYNAYGGSPYWNAAEIKRCRGLSEDWAVACFYHFYPTTKYVFALLYWDGSSNRIDITNFWEANTSQSILPVSGKDYVWLRDGTAEEFNKWDPSTGTIVDTVYTPGHYAPGTSRPLCGLPLGFTLPTRMGFTLGGRFGHGPRL